MKTYILVNSMAGGGAERQISYISRLKEIDKVICIEENVIYDMPKEKLIFLTKSTSSKSIASKFIQLFTALNALRKLKIDKQTHLICFLQLSMVLGVLCKIIFKCKLTLSIRLNPFMHESNTNERSISIKLLRFMLNVADHIIPNSIETGRDLSNHFPSIQHKVHTIQNGFDVSYIEKMADTSNQQYEKLLTENFCLVNAGRMDSQKGQWHLLRIFSSLLKENPHLKLIILGQGVFHDDLIELAEKLKLRVYVGSRDSMHENYDLYLVGFQSNPYFFYRHAKLFLFPSIYEGLPNALIEAILCSAPVISANCKSGPIEILLGENQISDTITSPVQSKFGYLMPAFSGELILNNSPLNEIENMWLQMCLELIQDEHKRIEMKKQSVELKNRYSFEKIQKEWIEFIAPE